MKKKIIIPIAIILIVIALFILYKNKKSKVEYEIEKISIYNYVKYKVENKYGVLNRSGETIIEAKYTNIEIPNPEKDIFLCYEDDKCIVLNAKQKQLFKKYDKVEAIKLKNIASTLCYEKSTLTYKKDGLYGLVDFAEKELTKNIYQSIENLQGTEGKLLVCKNGKYGVININGTTIVEPKYDRVLTDEYYTEENSYQKSGFIVSNTENDGYKYGYINYQGKKVLDTKYNDIKRITSQKDIYLIASLNGKYGLYKEGKEIIKPEYQSITFAENGAIILDKNGKYGIATLKGEIKVTPKYTEINENGIYLYARDSKDNIVYDGNGNKIEINFNKVIYKTTSENYKIVTILNNDVVYYGIEDKDGTTLVNTEYSYLEHISGDNFIAQNKNEKYGIINSNGITKIEFKYDLIQKIKDKEIIQLSTRDSKDVDFYSSKLEKLLTLKSAKVNNKTNYVKIYNDEETIFLDKEGNKLEENSEIVQTELKTELPETINGYKKVQYSLEDVYYEIQ